MESSIIKKISELVASELPGLQANEFKKYIEDSQNNITRLENASKTVAELIKKIEDLKLELGVLQALKIRKDDLDKKHIELETIADTLIDKERSIELTILKNRLADKEALINNVFSWNAILAKNPRAIELFSERNSEFQAPYYRGNDYITPTSINREKDSAKESVETKDTTPLDQIAQTGLPNA